MSKIIASSAIRGAHQIVRDAEDYLAKAIAAKGIDCAVGFPDTAYSLPVIYSLLGERVDRLSDMQKILDECHRLLPPVPSENLWLPYLGGTLDSGIATLFAFEIIEACKYLIGPNPIDGIWLGAANDVIIRERGVEFVDGSAPGFAAIVGAAPTVEDAVRIARELQEKNLYVFMAGHSHGTSFSEQLAEAGVEMGWETRLVPYGKEISAAVYALGFANRVALSFGGVKPGDFARNLKYNKNRTFAFVMALGEVTEEKYAAAAGAINYGFPTIADTDIPQILPTGICTYEHVVSNVPIDHIVEKCLEVRGCKIKVAKVPIPVAFGAAFEGERIRKEQTYVEFGGNKTPGFEYVTTLDITEVEDGKIEVIGPEIDDVVVDPNSSELPALPIGIWVEVAGRKMQPDFEPILERQIHHMINGAEGIWHMGQRDINWIRISKAAKDKGFKIAHLGEILHAKFLNDYPAIVDKVQVKIFTNPQDVEERIDIARHVLPGPQSPHGVAHRRERGHLLLLPALPEFRAQSRLRDHARTAGTVRRLQLAGRQGGLRDRSHRPQPAADQGRVHRPGARAVGQHQRLRLRQLQADPGALQRLFPAGRSHDQLRLLRGHRGPDAGSQRGHDRQPRVPGRDPGRHEVLHHGEHGRRRPAGARLRGRRQSLRHQP